MEIDTTFDFRTDAGGRDPDAFSPTLRRYHKALWSKPLPDGRPFFLSVTTKGAYLYHRSDAGEFWLASDAVMPTFTRWAVTKPIVEQVSQGERDAFNTITYTIGGMMVFPGNRVDGKPTINVARGFNRAIADRMDLTLECIRRHYLGERSPLAATLDRYERFFALFGDFAGYVRFFLLDDLLTADGQAVAFFAPFDDFKPPAIPRDLESYRSFVRHSVEFVVARNRRIATWAMHRGDAGG